MESKLADAIGLGDFPEPPAGMDGWPWKVTWSQLRSKVSNGTQLPKISIITPCLNQGDYLEETIRSVLLQGYPNIEYFIIDGGSTDQSLNIIRKYEQWLTGWVSEKDDGQSAAINKGYDRCTGEIFNWLCSDDLLVEGALEVVARKFMQDTSCDVLAGACLCQYDEEQDKSLVRSARVKNWELTPYAAAIWQPSCFVRRPLIERQKYVSEDLHYCMDRELWCYLLSMGARWRWIDETLSVYRYTGFNKSTVGKQEIIEELERIYRIYVPEIIPLPVILRRIWLPLVLKKSHHQSQGIKCTYWTLGKVLALILLVVYPWQRVRTLQHEFYRYSVG